MSIQSGRVAAQADNEWSFQVGLAPETLRRTNLGELSWTWTEHGSVLHAGWVLTTLSQFTGELTPGSPVNLERSVSSTTRMGGHFVQGATVAPVPRNRLLRDHAIIADRRLCICTRVFVFGTQGTWTARESFVRSDRRRSRCGSLWQPVLSY